MEELQYMGKVFQSISGQPYCYVTETNRILTIDSDWFHAVPVEERELRIFQELEAAGELSQHVPDGTVWPKSLEEYREDAAKHIRSLILELTQQCTLRCNYCIYSGNYTGVRTHQNVHMTKEILEKSIDYFTSCNQEASSADILFYGGEALLTFDLVRYAVDYARKTIRGKPLSFHISSNGTTLNDQVIDWLASHEDVSITITVNGPMHDQYRKFPDGKGSLAFILSSLEKLRSHGSALWDRVDFIANVASHRELLDLCDFYRQNIGKPPLLITGILTAGGNEIIQQITKADPLDEDARDTVHRLYCKTCDAYISCYYRFDMEDLCRRPLSPLGNHRIYTACCMPFVDQLFVAADGTIGVCEKMGANSQYGTVNTGIRLQAAESLMRAASVEFNKQCRTCWAQRLCHVCFQDFQRSDAGVLFLPDEVCVETRKIVETDLILFCSRNELHPEIQDG